MLIALFKALLKLRLSRSPQIELLKGVKQTHQLKDLKGSLDKFMRQIHELTAVVDVWWSWVDCCLSSHNLESYLQDWVKQQLLPALYWQQQVSRTQTPTLKRAYQVATELAFSSLMRHPITASLESEHRQQWFDWASWMVSKFQRSSSAVEGRNGYLSQVYHNRRGLSSRRLQVMTVIHNFHLKRPDGTTAAERLFGQEFPDLFQWLVSDLGELPHPRKPRKPRKPKTFALPTVPS